MTNPSHAPSFLRVCPRLIQLSHSDQSPRYGPLPIHCNLERRQGKENKDYLTNNILACRFEPPLPGHNKDEPTHQDIARTNRWISQLTLLLRELGFDPSLRTSSKQNHHKRACTTVSCNRQQHALAREVKGKRHTHHLSVIRRCWGCRHRGRSLLDDQGASSHAQTSLECHAVAQRASVGCSA